MTERALRKHARRKIEVSASLKIAGKDVVCKTRELSEGGLFVVVDTPLDVGSKTAMNLKIGNDSVKVDGEVIYTLSKEKALEESREPGMGIRFINLAPAVKNKLTSLIF